jgi:hypothetical protein
MLSSLPSKRCLLSFFQFAGINSPRTLWKSGEFMRTQKIETILRLAVVTTLYFG